VTGHGPLLHIRGVIVVEREAPYSIGEFKFRTRFNILPYVLQESHGGNGSPSFRCALLNKDGPRLAPTVTLHCYLERRMAGVAFKVDDGSNTFHPIHQPLRIFF
jgi:hypothetical protein